MCLSILWTSPLNQLQYMPGFFIMSKIKSLECVHFMSAKFIFLTKAKSTQKEIRFVF